MPKIAAPPSVVRKVVNALRGRIFTMPDGQLLGSEEAIMTELGVSRPSFRQAAKLLEQEQILSIKRGVGGGYFARRPSISAVAHTAAVFLQSREATLADVIAASRPLFIETARRAAMRTKKDDAGDIEAFATRERAALRGELDTQEFLASERHFWKLMSPLSGNPVLELFMMVVFDFAARMTRDTVYEGASRIRAYRTLRSRLIEAILEGDEEIAATLARRCNDLLTLWLEQRTKGGTSERLVVHAEGHGAAAVPARAPAPSPSPEAAEKPASPGRRTVRRPTRNTTKSGA